MWVQTTSGLSGGLLETSTRQLSTKSMSALQRGYSAFASPMVASTSSLASISPSWCCTEHLFYSSLSCTLSVVLSLMITLLALDKVSLW